MHEYFLGWRRLHPEDYSGSRHYIVSTCKIAGSRRVSLGKACHRGLRSAFGRVLKNVYVKPFTLVRRRKAKARA